MLALLESIGVTIVAAAFAAAWHLLAKPGNPETGDFAIGLDVLVATAVSQLTFIENRHGQEVTAGWIEFGLVFAILLAMTVMLRIKGYEHPVIYVSAGHNPIPVYPMTRSAPKWANSVGCAVFCASWWVNVNIGVVIQTWRDLAH